MLTTLLLLAPSATYGADYLAATAGADDSYVNMELQKL